MLRLQQNNKINIDWKFLALVALLCLIFGYVFRCSPKPVKVEVNPLKEKIQKEKVKVDSLKKDALKKDSVRIVYITKWRTIKLNPDSLPCDTFVKLVIAHCDTVILKDSSTIVSLKEVIKQDSIIISYQGELIVKDSVHIAKLEKKLKWQKVKTKLAFFVGSALGVGATTAIKN
jgi:hypothetical protein